MQDVELCVLASAAGAWACSEYGSMTVPLLALLDLAKISDYFCQVVENGVKSVATGSVP